MSITILSWGGIGDTLRNISLVPHQALFQRWGIRCRVVYRHWRTTGALPHAEPPEAEFFESLINRIPSLQWVGESEAHQGIGRALNKGLREIIKVCNGNAARYFPFELQLTPAEQAALPRKQGQSLRIGIQTHLSGMRTKQWGTANWRQFLSGLLEAHPGAELVLFDREPGVAELCFDPRISSTCSLNIAQSIALIGQLDFLVSIDSWSKYAAAWQKIPQLIVVPDQRPEYPGLTAKKLVHEEFCGIYGQPNTYVVGLSGTKSAPSLTLGNLADLSPQSLLDSTLGRLACLIRLS